MAAGSEELSNSRMSLALGGEPIVLKLPRVPLGRSKARLMASARPADSSDPFGVWEFTLGPSLGDGRLVLSPTYLDQGFLVLDHPGSPPLGRILRLEPPPDQTKAIDLLLTISSAYGDGALGYRLEWLDESSRNHCFHRWRQDSIPPIDWFYVELTSHCNLACPFCPSKDLRRPRAFMTLDNARTIFGKIGDYVRRRESAWGYNHIRRMVFLHVMGEPLLHPQFVDCIRIARDAKLIPALFTNATLLNAGNRRKVFDARLTHITVGLNVTQQAAYSALGARDSFSDQEERVADLLRERARLDAHQLHVDIQYMVSAGRAVAGSGLIHSRQQAWEKYREWLLLLRHIGPGGTPSVERRPMVDVNTLDDPLVNHTGDSNLRLSLVPGVDFVLKSGCSFGNTVVSSGMRAIPTRVGRCPFDNPSRQMAVFVDGSVSFCNLDAENSLHLGNLLGQKIEEIWSGPRLQRIRREMAANELTEPLCQRCMGALVPLDPPSASKRQQR